jgi:hypothetical protein
MVMLHKADGKHVLHFLCQENQRPDVYFRHFCVWSKETPSVEGDWVPFDPNVRRAPGALAIHLEDIEHAAGPGCRYTRAENKNRITLGSNARLLLP